MKDHSLSGRNLTNIDLASPSRIFDSEECNSRIMIAFVLWLQEMHAKHLTFVERRSRLKSDFSTKFDFA